MSDKGGGSCPDCGAGLLSYYDKETNQTCYYCPTKGCGYVATEGGDQT